MYLQAKLRKKTDKEVSLDQDGMGGIVCPTGGVQDSRLKGKSSIVLIIF